MTDQAAMIAILLPDLRGGGAERLHVHLAEAWLARGYDVEFILLQQRGELLGALPKGVRLVNLSAPRLRDALWPLRAYLRQRQPTVVLAAMWPLTVITSMAAILAGIGTRCVLSEHAVLSQAYRHKGRAHRLLMRLSMALCYRLADVRITVSAGVAADLATLSGIGQDGFRVIYNPAAVGADFNPDEQDPPELTGIVTPLILAVGTLKAVKNYPLLIAAFARLLRLQEATLCILGEGELRSDLEQCIAEHGLQGRVLLPGFRLDTGPWYRQADLFVLSSRHEGFGNVIVEALEQGVPVVSTDCPSGPREILCDGKYGRLVPVEDIDAMAEAMRRALSEVPDRELLRARARDFSVERIADQYLDVMLPDRQSGQSV